MEALVSYLVKRWNKDNYKPLSWEEVCDRLLSMHYFAAAEYVAETYLNG